MKGTCEQIPFHFFLKFMMLSIAGGLDFSFTIPIQLTIIKNVRLPAKARNYIHLHQGDMTEK